MKKIWMVMILLLAVGCTRFAKILRFETKKQDKNEVALIEESKALTTAVVDTLSQTPTNKFTALALDFARKDQLIEGLPQARIDVDGLLSGDKVAFKELEDRYQLQKDLIAEKAKLAVELEATKEKLVEMGAKYEAERNTGILRRIRNWAIGTLGIGGVIALLCFCPALIPVFTRIVAGIISAIPKLAGFFGVVGKGAWDATVHGIESAKSQLDENSKNKLEASLARTMDRAHKELVKVTQAALPKEDLAQPVPAQ